MESIIGCGKFNRSKDKDLIEARSALVQAWIDDVERAFEKVDKNLPDMMARHIADICYRESEQLKKQITMERKIGEIFEYNGEWYQCVESPDCTLCAFNETDCNDIDIGDCASYKRSDGKSVIFKKLEKVGEPFVIEKVLYQHYKVFDIDNVYGDGFFWCVHNYKARTLTIGLKQNKEDMEENKTTVPKGDNALTRIVYAYVNGKISDKELIRSIKEMSDEYPYNKNNLKPFSLELAKQGKPVCTRDGRKARIICFDRKGDQPIIALIEAKGNKDALIEKVERYFINGHSVFEVRETNDDLMMLPEKKEGWINIYNADTTFYYADGRVFETKDEAVQEAKEEVEKEQREKNEYIDTIRVEWEE